MMQQPSNPMPMFAQNLSGYPTMPQGNVQPFATYVAAPSDPIRVVQLPCAPQMNAFPTQPYQLVTFPQQGVILPCPMQGMQGMVAPQMQGMQGTPQMTVFQPLQQQAHPLMKAENSQFGSPNSVDPSMMQWKRDPASNFNWNGNRDQSFNFQPGMSPPSSYGRNMGSNHVMNFNRHVNNRMGPNHFMHPRKSKKKYGFRSKQNMIDKVYLALVEKYEKRGILAGDDEVLRGDDTIRLHVKKFKALQRIEEALLAAERMDSITISRVSIPLSMKNQFQKKGFLVYVQVEKVWMVPLAQKIFRQFDEFKKCDVARHTVEAESPKSVEGEMDTEVKDTNVQTSTTLNDKKEIVSEPVFIEPLLNVEDGKLPAFDDLFTPAMIPQRSCGEMGQ